MTIKLATCRFAPLRVAGCVAVLAAATLLPAGCDMQDEGSTRVLSRFVIQVDVLARAGKNPLPLNRLAAAVEADTTLILDPVHREASSSTPFHPAKAPASSEPFAGTGSYYLVFPARVSASDIKTIHFSMPGYRPLAIDYQSYQRVPYTPPEVNTLSPQAKNPCAAFNELGAFKFSLTLDTFIEYVLNRLPHLEETALAAAPSIPMCHLIFRQREQITITLDPLY